VLGLVYQPGWAEGLRMSVDRYEVDIADSIATLADDDIVRECALNGVLCEYVIRDNTGTLTRVFRPYLNLDQAKVRGIDYEVAYNRDVDWFAGPNESFSLRLLGGTLDTRTNTVAGSVPDELAGAGGEHRAAVVVEAAGGDAVRAEEALVVLDGRRRVHDAGAREGLAGCRRAEGEELEVEVGAGGGDEEDDAAEGGADDEENRLQRRALAHGRPACSAIAPLSIAFLISRIWSGEQLRSAP